MCSGEKTGKVGTGVCKGGGAGERDGEGDRDCDRECDRECDSECVFGMDNFVKWYILYMELLIY